MNVKGTARLRCKHCGAILSLDGSQWNYEPVGSDNRQMGSETEYRAECKVVCECEKTFEGEIKIYEYPVNVFNHTVIDIAGIKEETNDIYADFS